MRGAVKTFDFELTRDHCGDTPGMEGYVGASVLVRLNGIPIGCVDVPACRGILRADDLARRTIEWLAPENFREGARQSLLSSGIPAEWTLPVLSDDGAFGGMSATVAVCTRDRPDDLANCLAAILEMDYPGKDVLVVDNAPSTNATARLVQERFPEVRYVREDRPGLDNARNRAITESRGEIVAFTDDDVTVDKHWLAAIVAAFEEDPDAGAVTGLVAPLELEHEAQIVFEACWGFGRGYLRRRAVVPPGRAMTAKMLGTGSFGTGANMAYRRSLFADIGLFDPALDVGTMTNGGGDLEMFMRVLKSGWALVYEPAALVRHRHRRTMADLRRQMTDHGLGFRSYCERVRSVFPEERSGLRALKRWWWMQWAWARWRRSIWRPALTPRDLIEREIRGFWQGRGRYAAARAAAGVDESNPPDRLTGSKIPPEKPPGARGGAPVFRIDVAEPVPDLAEAAGCDDVVLDVHWRGRPITSFLIPARRRPVPARRVAEEIAARCYVKLLAPGLDLPDSLAWPAAVSRLVERFRIGAGTAPEFPVEAAVSVVVATRDRPGDLRRCLASLARLDTVRPVEIIVVDNNPASGLTAAVAREFPDVGLIDEPRAGLSYARNAGIAAARGEIIVTTDDDVAAPADWIERLVAPFARTDVLAVTGNVLPARMETSAERLFEQYGGLGRGCVRREFDQHWFQWFRRRAAPTWEIGATANAAFRADIFSQAEIGPMDEALGAGAPTGCSEDTLVFYRILLAGGTIVYEPAAFVWHHHRATEDALRKQLYNYSRGHVAYHLCTFLAHGDGRGLWRVFVELPRSFLARAWRRARRRTRYSWRLLATEGAGALSGPWALWQARRRVRRLGPGARRPETKPVQSASSPAAAPPATAVKLHA